MDDRETGIVSSNGLLLEKNYSPRRHEEHEEGFRLASFIFVFFVPSWLKSLSSISRRLKLALRS
jgi:hypothetical protein